MRINQFTLRPYSLVILSLLLFSVIFTSCTDEPKRENRKEKVNKEEEKKNSKLFEIEGKVFSIPSPIQTAFLLKDAGANYQSGLLSNTENVSEYTTTSAKALNLGIYGADLGYATIYDQNQDAISYMAVTKRLSNELGVSGLFNENTIKRFESNIGNQDSLLVLVSDAFKSADSYLKNNEQNDLSVLILAGGWVETLHFATQLAKATDNEAIKNRIGEQKITIKNLIKLMLPYKENQQVADLSNKLNELKDLYKDIEFIYEWKEPTTDAENKTTTINSVSKVKMSKEQLQNITDKITAIRNSIIQ
jgi:hypothetical protein